MGRTDIHKNKQRQTNKCTDKQMKRQTDREYLVSRFNVPVISFLQLNEASS